MEDMSMSRGSLLEDTDFNRLDDEAQEAQIEAEERLDELMWALSRLKEAREDGDPVWIADATDELNLLLN